MKGKWQPIAGKSKPDLRAEVSEHVFRLNQAVSSLRRLIRRSETVVDGMADADPELADLLAAGGRQVDLIYQTMVQVRWAALGTDAPQGPLHPVNHSGSAPGSGTLEQGRATVFVIDGDPTSLQALSHLFNKMNYRVEAFASVRQYLALQPVAHPACVVANLSASEQDGPEMQRHLIETDGRYPVIFLAVQRAMEEGARDPQGGAADFLPEDYDQHDLLEAVKRALQGDLNRRNP